MTVGELEGVSVTVVVRKVSVSKRTVCPEGRIE